MVHLDAPYVDAGLYWHNDSPQISFRQVCQLLIQQGMDTVDYGEFAAPNDALLASLEQPQADVRPASFMNSSKKRSGARPTHRPPGKVIVSYGWLSDVAQAHGDHPAMQVTWGGGSFGYTAPDAPVKGLQAYHFFTLLCAQLDPLYAVLDVEREALCLYDVLHPSESKSYSSLPLSEFYCQQGILGEAEEAFWHTYAYHERLPHGTYGSDYSLFNPRRRSLGGDWKQRSHVVTKRRTMVMSALKHLVRTRHSE
jgi:hypothetical protein